jgi:hypothetical protein
MRRIAERLVEGPRWKTRVVLVVVVFSLLRAFPNYNFLRERENQETWKSAAIKIQNPTADMARLFPPAQHEAKLTFRLTVPLIARAFHLDRNGLLALFALCGVLTLYLTLDLAHQITRSRIAALSVCVAVACIWPGILAFHQLLGGFYDAVAICLMLTAMRVPPPFAALALLAAAWTDERALLAAPLLLVCAALRRDRPRVIALSLAAVAYAVTRLWFAAAYGLRTPADGIGPAILLKNFNMLPLGIWTGLAGCWLLVAAGLYVLFAHRRYLAALSFAVTLSAIIAAALIVEDVTRSMSYTLPAVFVALIALSESEPPSTVESLTAISALLCVVIPTYFTQSGAATWMLPSFFQAIRLALYPRLG